MNDTIQLPFYAKLTLILVCLIAIFTILYFGQNIIIPILLSLLFAVLLRPITRFLKNKLHFPHVIAVIVSVTLFVLIFVGLFYFILYQVSDIANDWDKIKTNLWIHIDHLQEVIRANFNLTKREQKTLIDNATQDTGKTIVGNTLLSFTDILLNLTLIPIYTFLFLLYRTHFMKFLAKLFKTEHHLVLQDIIGQIKVSIQSYIIGLIIEMIGVIVLTTIGYMIIGVQYAIVLGIITGLLNLIPYIGFIFAVLLSLIATLTGTPDLSLIVGVLVVNTIVQLIDNNLLVPLIVSSKVQINAFVSIVGIIIGGAIAGFSGMFLAIPVIAIFKVIFDKIEPLKPWGYLMGDDIPKTYTWRHIKLPLLDSEATEEMTQVNAPTFTENTTESNKMTQK